MRKRMSLALIGLTCVFALLIIRLSYIMLVKRDEYLARAEEQWTSEVKIDARRGRVLDRNGVELAVSANVYRVDFDLNSIRSYLKKENTTNEAIAPLIAEALELDNEKVLKSLRTKLPSGKDAGADTLIRRIDKERADKVKDLDIHGVIVSPDTKRYYPNDNFLAHVLGTTNSDGKGLTGVELQYNNYLSGIPGMRISELDRMSNELPYTISRFTSPVEGKDVTLTIDENLQAFAEKAAEQGYIDNKAAQVSVMIMDPNTGEILAMANKPDFNPNEPQKGFEEFSGATDGDKLQKMWRNRLVNDTFEPGSIFKVVTMIANMEEGLVKETDTFNCTGSKVVGGHTIKCWKTSGHGTQTLPEILQNSCNVGFMELGAKLGNEKMKEYIDKFGFGQISQIDLPGESEGIIKSVSDMSEMDLATIAFGQTNTVNSIQLMQAFNAIANGGTLIQPHIMKEISYTEENGTKVIDEEFEPITKQNIISESTAATLRNYLERTLNQGTKVGAFMGVERRVGGKSGTAETVDPITGGYSSDKYIASVIALYPVEKPEVTIYVKVENPSTGVYYGGQVATPLLKDLLTELFKYMDSQIYKDRYTETKNVIVPEIRGKTIEEAKEILASNNLNMSIEADGDKVTNMVPYPGALVEENSTIGINLKENKKDPNKIIMPNLKGKTLEEAVEILNKIGINDYKINGEGIVKSQDVIAGKIIEKTTKVKLDLNN